jgi:hypothetical protein
VTGTAAQVTADLDALIFHPTPYQVAPGNTVTTGFTIEVTNSPVGLSATDNTTSVIATAIAPNYPLLQQMPLIRLSQKPRLMERLQSF